MAKKLQKKRVTENIEVLSPYDLEGDLTRVIKMLQDYCVNSKYDNLILDFSSCGHRAYEDSPTFLLKGIRLETDEELKVRQFRSDKASKSAAKAVITRNAAKERKERAEYEKLKAKYGD